MILLDSNVVSALMRLHLEPTVRAWLRRQSPFELFTSTPTVFEIRFGIECRPQGRQRRALETACRHVISSILGNRILSLDEPSAAAAGRARAIQIGMGNNVAIVDSQVAGVALAHRATVATRNTRDFSGLGLTLVDPWH